HGHTRWGRSARGWRRSRGQRRGCWRVAQSGARSASVDTREPRGLGKICSSGARVGRRGSLALAGARSFRARTQSPHIWHYGVCSLKALLVDWKLVLTIGGAAIAGLAMIAYAFFRPAVNPEDAERKRRLHL